MHKIAIIGTGYVGLVSGAGFSEFGHQVICSDIDKAKISMLKAGDVPIYEPGLKSLVNHNMNAGRLRFSDDSSSAIRSSNIIFIAVGTPEDKNGDTDLSAVEAVIKTISENLNNYKELHDWIIGLGFPKDYTQFQTMQATGADRFSGSTRSTAATGTNTPQPLNEGGIYSDATLTVLNSKNIAKTEIRFQNVFPISLGSLSYDVKASDVDYLQVQASFNYMYYEIVQISTS